VRLPTDAGGGALWAARDRYCERIVTGRLYDHLDHASQRALSRVAVYGVPVTLEGFAAAAGESLEKLRTFSRQWRDYALVYPEREGVADEVWRIYGLLRGWLVAPERLGPDDRRAAHRAAGDFLRDVEGRGEAGRLGLSALDCLLEARRQYVMAGDAARARLVTVRISISLLRWGLYDDLIRLNQAQLAVEEHPQPMRGIGRAYYERGAYAAARDWCYRALAAAGGSMPSETAAAWHDLAMVDMKVADYTVARERLETSLEIRQRLDDRTAEAATRHGLATLELNVGDYEAAREQFEALLSIFQGLHDRSGEAATWHQLGVIDLHVDDTVGAREKLETALRIRRQIGEYAASSATWHNLASIDLKAGNHAEARENFETALRIAKEVGNRAEEAGNLQQLAWIDMHEGNVAGARLTYEEALRICQRIGDRVGEATGWHNLAYVDRKEGDLAGARDKLESALSISRAIGDRAGEAAAWHNLGSLDMDNGDEDAARDKLFAALDLRRHLGVCADEADTLYQLGFLALKRGRRLEGLRLVALCVALHRSVGRRDAEATGANLMALAADLDYGQQRVETLLREVAEAYAGDRGRGLVTAAFREDE